MPTKRDIEELRSQFNHGQKIVVGTSANPFSLGASTPTNIVFDGTMVPPNNWHNPIGMHPDQFVVPLGEGGIYDIDISVNTQSSASLHSLQVNLKQGSNPVGEETKSYENNTESIDQTLNVHFKALFTDLNVITVEITQLSAAATALTVNQALMFIQRAGQLANNF